MNKNQLSEHPAEIGRSFTGNRTNNTTESRSNSDQNSSSKNSTACSDRCSESSDEEDVSMDSLSVSAVPCSHLIGLRERMLKRTDSVTYEEEKEILSNSNSSNSSSFENRNVLKNIKKGITSKSEENQQQKKIPFSRSEIKNAEIGSKSNIRVDDNYKSIDKDVCTSNELFLKNKSKTNVSKKKLNEEIKVKTKSVEKTNEKNVFSFENSDYDKTEMTTSGILTQVPSSIGSKTRNSENSEIGQIKISHANQQNENKNKNKNSDFIDEKRNRYVITSDGVALHQNGKNDNSDNNLVVHSKTIGKDWTTIII